MLVVCRLICITLLTNSCYKQKRVDKNVFVVKETVASLFPGGVVMIIDTDIGTGFGIDTKLVLLSLAVLVTLSFNVLLLEMLLWVLLLLIFVFIFLASGCKEA